MAFYYPLLAALSQQAWVGSVLGVQVVGDEHEEPGTQPGSLDDLLVDLDGPGTQPPDRLCLGGLALLGTASALPGQGVHRRVALDGKAMEWSFGSLVNFQKAFSAAAWKAKSVSGSSNVDGTVNGAVNEVPR